MKKNFINSVTGLLLVSMLILMSSCSGDDYLNAIPGNSTALVSVDLKKLASSAGDDNTGAGVLKSLLGTDDVAGCGIDLKSKIYMFESADGNLGLVAKVGSVGDMEALFASLAKDGKCTPVAERKNCKFTLVNGSWSVGFSSDALVVMGPVVASQQAEMQQVIARYLAQDEERSIKGTPIFEKLDSIAAPLALVAQSSALPESFVSPITLGAPKDADASQVMVAAGLTVADGCLNVDCETFSFNNRIDTAMKESLGMFRPINGTYAGCVPSDAAGCVFMNVDGSRFIKLLHANKGIGALLAGINTAIDIDNIIRCIDGDMSVAVMGYNGDKPELQMSAQLGKRDFLADVAYWKKSCPAGSRIENWEKDAYRYTDGALDFYFGVSADNQFYSGVTPEKAKSSIVPAKSPYSESVISRIKGGKLCLVLSLDAIVNGQADVIRPFIKPLFGDVSTVFVTVGK